MTPNDGAGPTVIGLVTQGLAEVKEAVSQLSRDLHTALGRLPNDYVPRREVERRFDELSVDLGAERAERLRAIQALEEAHRAAAAARAEDRRWRWGLATGSAISLLGVASGIYLHFH